LLKGLRERWCPKAELVEGKFRGFTGLSRRREIPRICLELSNKGADLVIFLTDSNDDGSNAWRYRLREEEGRIPPNYEHFVLVGVCQRNVECWFCSDAEWLSRMTGRSASDFRTIDPKGVFESAMQISCRDRKEKEITDLARIAPLHQWLQNRSFEDFFDKLWQKSKEIGCSIENLRERH
jgi:hypothetical protein